MAKKNLKTSKAPAKRATSSAKTKAKSSQKAPAGRGVSTKAKSSKPSAKPAAKRPAPKAAVVKVPPLAKSTVAVKPVPKSSAPMLTQGQAKTKPSTGKVLPTKLSKLRRQPKPPAAPVVITSVQPTAPPTSEKPARNSAGLSDRELDFYRDLLLAKRREIMGDMSSMEREALREQRSDLSNLPVHMADQGTDAYEQEFTLTLVEKDRQLLREINAALAKIQDGSYGICEGTGKPIGKPRLEAQPWARYSIEHARELERRPGHFRR